MEIINDPVPTNLSKPLRPENIDTPTPETSEVPTQPTSTFWRDILPVGVEVVTNITKTKYPHVTRGLLDSKDVISTSGGYLLDKYVPMNFGGMDSAEMGHIIALGMVGLGLFKAYKEDTTNENRTSERVSRVIDSVPITDQQRINP